MRKGAPRKQQSRLEVLAEHVVVHGHRVLEKEWRQEHEPAARAETVAWHVDLAGASRAPDAALHSPFRGLTLHSTGRVARLAAAAGRGSDRVRFYHAYPATSDSHDDVWVRACAVAETAPCARQWLARARL